MLTDIALLAAILFITYRSVRQSSSTNIVQGPNLKENVKEIEESIKKLISEAEESSRELNKDLSRKQRSLEQILFDIESVETKISRTTSSAQEKIEELTQLVNLTEVKAKEFNKINQNSEVEVKKVEIQTTVTNKQQEITEISLTDVEVEEVQESRYQDRNLNIFGEPISEAVETDNYQPLSARIEIQSEKKITRPPVSSSNMKEVDAQSKIHKIMNQAKLLLKDGEDIISVATQLRIPSAAVQRINDQMLREKVSMAASEEKPKRDSRLGALGSMRRNAEMV
ncbi:MAG: hypothetical protein SGJ02_10410 [bacterium]|nr:hypothetical protein [bacterium]